MAINTLPSRNLGQNQQRLQQRQAAGGTGQKFMANHPRFAQKQAAGYQNFDKNQAALAQRQANGGSGQQFLDNHPIFAQRNAAQAPRTVQQPQTPQMPQAPAPMQPPPAPQGMNSPQVAVQKPAPMPPPSYQQGQRDIATNQAAEQDAFNEMGASLGSFTGGRPFEQYKPQFNGSWQASQVANQGLNEYQQGQAQQGMGQAAGNFFYK